MHVNKKKKNEMDMGEERRSLSNRNERQGVWMNRGFYGNLWMGPKHSVLGDEGATMVVSVR